MKKNTLVALVAYLNGETVTNLDEIKSELEAELNKNAEKAAANKALYEQTREIVLGAIAEKPMTIAEIWDAVKNEVPEGMTKSKVQYALREYWANDVEKTVGKVMEYKRA